MYKLSEINKNILDKHEKYFEEEIKNKFENYKIEVNNKNTSEIIELIEEHNNFVDECSKQWKDLAIGDTKKLEKICKSEKIGNRYINLKDKFKNCIFVKDEAEKNEAEKNEAEKDKCVIIVNSKNEQLKNYSKFIEEMFGYDSFNNISLYSHIKNRTKKDNEGNFTKKNYEKFNKILKECFSVEIKYENCGKDHELEAEFNKQDIAVTLNNLDKIELEWSPYSYIFSTGLIVCPYCNQQYITPIFSDNGKMRADIDHIKPKSEYPYLSMSIYNFLPSCKFCNQSLKIDKAVDINPYTHNLDEMFKFSYDTINSCVNVSFPHDVEETKRIKEYLQVFKIKQRYQYHVNIAENLILKHRIYNENYSEEILLILNEDENGKKYTKENLEELIVGFERDEKKINDDILNKFRRDIYNQIVGEENGNE